MNYRPELKPIRVPLQKLFLDPNNPRFLEDHSAIEEERNFTDPGVQLRTVKRMETGGFRLDDLKRSIETNGWQPVDMIFVKQLETLPGQYVVLEGNRRLMALRALTAQEGGLPLELRDAVDPLEVLEVLGAGDLDESRAQVSYLLGVRHHGSLKPWGPFAQAHNIYERYLQIGEMKPNSFKWEEKIAERISDQLSIGTDVILQRLRTYLAMQQLHEVPSIKSVGVEGKFYSLVQAALPAFKKSSALNQYIIQDPSTFRLDSASLAHFDALCHFSTPKRAGAPISSPDEWRPFARVLADPDVGRREEMLYEIQVKKRSPSDVSAERQAELRQPRWDRWLEEVNVLLKKLQISSLDVDDEKATQVATRLAKILDALNAKAQNETPVGRS